MLLVVTGKADTAMETNATTVRCGDESLKAQCGRVRTQMLVQKTIERTIERQYSLVQKHWLARYQAGSMLLLPPNLPEHVRGGALR